MGAEFAWNRAARRKQASLARRTPKIERPISATAAPPLDIGIVPLEPRIMMDATLDLGLDGYFNHPSLDQQDAIANLLKLAGASRNSSMFLRTS